MLQCYEAGMRADIDRSVHYCSANYNCSGYWRSLRVSSHMMVAQVYDTCEQTCEKMGVY